MKKILSVFMTVAIVFGAALTIGCKDNSENENTLEEVTLADFEQWASDFQLIRLVNRFGSVTRNSDSRYVYEGEYSAMLRPTGAFASRLDAGMYFPLTSNMFDFSYTDMTSVEFVGMQIYNANEEEKRVTVGLLPQTSPIEIFGGEDVLLAPGWNKIRYFIDREIANISYDITSIAGIYIGFENAGVRELSEAPIYYLDNVKLYRTKNAEVIPDVVTLDPNEICSFDKIYQEYTTSTLITVPETTPELKVVTAKNYGIDATSEKKVLRCLTNPGVREAGSYPRIIIPEKLMKKAGISELEDFAKNYICFDVYNASDVPITLYSQFYMTMRGGGIAFQFTAQPGQWTYYKISLQTIENAYPGTVSNIGPMMVAWTEYTENVQYELFFDSFRIETEG